MRYRLTIEWASDPPAGAPAHLLGLLEVSVRMRIADLTVEAFGEAVASGRVSELAQVIAEKGDVLMFRGRPGESARAFNALAEAVTYAACVPGGVLFLGCRWTAEPIRTGI